MTVAELLKSKGIAEEVAAGLSPEVAAAINSHFTEVDNTLKTASEKEAAAAEAFRLAGLEKKEVTEYVEKYGTSLTQLANEQAKNKALTTYLESLKAQGFEIEIPNGTAAKAPEKKVTDFNADEFKGQVGAVMAQVLNATNEYARLHGQPFPDDMNVIAREAAQARKSPYDYIADKYKFAAKREEQTAAAQKAHDDKIRQEATEEANRKHAERNGSNPMIRGGVPSNNSFVPKIKTDEFQKSSGNTPHRERMRRALDGIHRDVESAKSA